VSVGAWQAEWGVTSAPSVPGGLGERHPAASPRTVYLLHRGTSKPGARLGRTSGWVHRSTLAARGVEQLGGVRYRRIDDDGLHLRHAGGERVLAVDQVVVCAGQEPRRELYDALRAMPGPGPELHLVGGAGSSSEPDAERAIAEATRLAARLA
jgi:2,4-dienoyl-CoA reductase (NADPH2)